MTRNGPVPPAYLTENKSNQGPSRSPSIGVVIGKFMPPHRGHEYLAQFASAFVDKLWIFVCSLPGEPISGELRFQWMQDLFPHAKVVHIHEVNPAANRNQAGAQEIWAQAVIAHTINRPDFVFASEEYGWGFAQALAARFIPVDPSRDQFPISGSELRRHPFRNWHFIPGIVRSFFVKEIGIKVTESSQLHAEDITHKAALLLNTLYVPDYAAFYRQFSGPEIPPLAVSSLTQAKIALIKALKTQARCFLLRTVIEQNQVEFSGSGLELLITINLDYSENGSGVVSIEPANSPQTTNETSHILITCSLNTAAHAVRDVILDFYKDLF